MQIIPELTNLPKALNGLLNVHDEKIHDLCTYWFGGELKIFDDYVGPGYSIPTPEMAEAVRVFARTEGILLDPVYTGRAFAGLLERARRGELTGPVLFWHTGGSPAIFAYSAALTGLPKAPDNFL